MTARRNAEPDTSQPGSTQTPRQPEQPAKGGDGNRSDPSGYADYETERDTMGRGEPVPTQRSPVVPKK